MLFTYGQGEFTENNQTFSGQIILSEHKLYLKGTLGDIAQSYVPLEKVERVRYVSKGIELFVRPSLSYQYTVLIKGDRKSLDQLLKELVKRRGLQKVFLKKEWSENAK